MPRSSDKLISRGLTSSARFPQGNAVGQDIRSIRLNRPDMRGIHGSETPGINGV